MESSSPARFLPVRFRRPFLWAVGTIVLAGVLAYSNSFSGPFILDDHPSILWNRTIRHLGTQIFFPPYLRGETVGDRPLVNFTLALNYAVSGYRVWSYHAVNLLIHLLAALVLFGLVRRTLLQPVLRPRYGKEALFLAWIVALLWTVHPLQTESVTYIIQRAESLMGLCYLLVLYGFVRAMASARPNRWLALSVAACFFGVASKEVIVSAPLIVLLYERTFVTGSFLKAWRQRGFYYAALAGAWILLAVKMIMVGSRAETVGSVPGVNWQTYALSQFPALLHYLVLSFWPHPLVLDYGPAWVRDPWRAAPAALAVFFLLAATALALRHPPRPERLGPAWGFLGCWFFLILAPTSSVVPIYDTIFEHRMYLSLAAVIVAVVLGIHAVAGRPGLLALLLAAPVFIAVTMERNRDYRSALAIWSDDVAKRPGNAHARNNLGFALLALNRIPDAVAQFQIASQLEPWNAEVHCNMGVAFDQAGRLPEALDQYENALAIDPNNAHAYCNRGVVLAQKGRRAEAMEQYRKAIQLDPHYGEARSNLGVALTEMGRMPEGIGCFQAAIQVDPDYAGAHANLGDALGETGHFTEAIDQYREVLRINPENAEAYYNIGVALTRLRRFPEAIAAYTEALRINPGYANARNNLMALQAWAPSASSN